MPDSTTPWRNPSTYTNWLRLTTLGLGFLMMFGGVGVLVAFIVIPDPEMKKIWSVGLIPIMAGFGLTLFSIVSSKLVPRESD